MTIDKSLLAGSTSMLLLRLLEEKDRYGYEMIEALARKSDQTFSLKAGTLYPLLHTLEVQGLVTSYEDSVSGGRTRKYYSLTQDGKNQLGEKQKEWNRFSQAVDQVLKGGIPCEVF